MKLSKYLQSKVAMGLIDTYDYAVRTPGYKDSVTVTDAVPMAYIDMIFIKGVSEKIVRRVLVPEINTMAKVSLVRTTKTGTIVIELSEPPEC